jgi:hypothetical protein
VLNGFILFYFAFLDSESYDLRHRYNFNHTQSYASLATTYYVDDQEPGTFCIRFSVHRFQDFNLILVINSEVHNTDVLTPSISTICVDHDPIAYIKVCIGYFTHIPEVPQNNVPIFHIARSR